MFLLWYYSFYINNLFPPKDVLEVLSDNYISLADGKALLHLRNKGDTTIIITGLKIKGVELIGKANLGSTIGLFGNGIWIDKKANKIGLNVGGEGFIILDLNDIVNGMIKGEKYTLLIYMEKHGIIIVELLATTSINKTIQGSSWRLHLLRI